MAANRRQFLSGSLGMLVSALAARLNFARPPATKRFSAWDPQIRSLLARLSLDEKIGQMTQPDKNFIRNLDDLQTYHLGSVLSGGNSDPDTGNDLESWTNLYDRYQARALKTSPRIPILYGIDAVHGHNNVLGAVIFPHNIGLGCTRNAELVERAARTTAEEVRATGINWVFAPCLAVPQDVRWGRTYEGFSESPDVVKTLGTAAVRGFQGSGLKDPLSVLACAKHFAGDGGTVFGTGLPKRAGSTEHYPLDQGDTRLDDAAFRRIHLQAYAAAVAAGVGSIMPSYSSWNGVKCSANRVLLTDILKGEFGFEGFLISDYAALNELPGTYKQQIEQSINAGMDMVMVPDRYVEFIRLLRELVHEGRVPMSRINDAVTRILRVKFAMGLLDPQRFLLTDRRLHRSFGSPEHRAVARECVSQSLVLLKNEGPVLPLSPGASLHVAGKCADDIGNQCGGWTIDWQGESGPVTSGGTTILAAIREAAGDSTRVTFSLDGTGGQSARIGIAVIGEKPYAEMMGDRENLSLDSEDIAAVGNLKRSGMPVVVVVISGRPLALEPVLDQADAIVAAWLPGTEGGGVADVLFGHRQPSGKLSFTWPRGDSTSFHLGDPGYRTLFPFGYGLTY